MVASASVCGSYYLAFRSAWGKYLLYLVLAIHMSLALFEEPTLHGLQVNYLVSDGHSLTAQDPTEALGTGDRPGTGAKQTLAAGVAVWWGSVAAVKTLHIFGGL